ncbi:MAG: cytochrome P450 [Deltaproteobacteria bacterium]|nr:MAG: cytochrome P450 [Deltaproteobacteria bacterium]
MQITDGSELIFPNQYADRGYPHDIWTRLRGESPVHRCEPPGYQPFWAITKHADICDISKRPGAFENARGIVVLDDEQARMRETDQSGLAGMKTIIEMDPPVHRTFRKVASGWFTPRSLARLESAVEESARSLVDALAADGDGECDFVTRVAVAHPLRILSGALGVPREDEALILRLTNELFSSDDPEFQREGVTREERIQQIGLEFFHYFSKIIADRRANPRDDLATVLANAQIDGAPMGPVETLGYYLIVFTAGHDTTRNAISGGLLALLENPDQLARLRADPGLTPSAVEEIVRWTTPVNYMKRTVVDDVELRGQKIRAGEELMLCYASANRDEEVFDDPFAFRIERNPNRHLGFGIGEHFCLGAHLARRSQAALFGEIARRVEQLELAGEPQRTASSFVAGVKHLPVRYRFAKSR